jgi:hypothetical protein
MTFDSFAYELFLEVSLVFKSAMDPRFIAHRRIPDGSQLPGNRARGGTSCPVTPTLGWRLGLCIDMRSREFA